MQKHIFSIPISIIIFLFTTISTAQSSTHPEPNSYGSYHIDSENRCFECHEEDQPHEGILGENCSQCHSPDGWDQLTFDHGMNRFPLIGLHNDVDCDSCHAEKVPRTGTRTCKDCHLDDEPHEQAFGLSCENCHNPNGWEHWQFAHNEQTAFPLVDSHGDLECTACHKTAVELSDISPSCVLCHRKDDQHRGGFGDNCERCHQPTEFKDLKMPH